MILLVSIGFEKFLSLLVDLMPHPFCHAFAMVGGLVFASTTGAYVYNLFICDVGFGSILAI